MGAFAGSYVSAGVILLASLLVGRAILLALGRSRLPSWRVPSGWHADRLCSIAIRLPGNEATSIACCAVLLVASIVFLFVRSESILGPAVGIAIPIGVLSLLPRPRSPSLRAATSESPGSGSNNDMAMHLVDVDYLVDPPGRPAPQSVINGYPLGPHSLVRERGRRASTRRRGWLGLVVGACRSCGITALGGFATSPPAAACSRPRWSPSPISRPHPRRGGLQGADRRDVPDRLRLSGYARSSESRRAAIAVVIGLALITAAMVPVYSLPGVAWLAGTAGLGWSRSWSGFVRRRVRRASARSSARRCRS